MTPHRPHNLARWQKYAAALPVDRWLTVAELARLWWPETPTGKGRKAVEGRYFAAMAANKRLKMLVSAGLLEVETRPHPTRRQAVMHARRVLTWADRGRWMVGELA